MEQISLSMLKCLDKKFGSPFYIMDAEKYRKNITDFLDAFKIRYDKVLAGYSFKTNYVPALISVSKEEGCLAEVVSEMEYELAMKLGFKQIIFNGPIKRPYMLERAIKDGSIINLDSEYEVDYICKYKDKHPNDELAVGLRVNINMIDDDGNSSIQCGLRFGRFGFPSDIIGVNIERLRNAGVGIVSVHGHTSTSDRAVQNFKIITEQMLAVCEKYNLDGLKYFDIGGGFFGAAPEGMDITGRPKYEDYANCVLDVLLKNDWFVLHRPTIVIEPGSSVVSNVFKYYTKVYQNKRVGKMHFVMVDGTIFDVKPTMHSNILPHKAYTDSIGVKTCVCDVVGSTCMEKDVILKDVELPVLKAGDFIEFQGVGAYTISLTPTFINFLEPILMEKDGEYVEVRRRQDINDVLSVYNLK